MHERRLTVTQILVTAELRRSCRKTRGGTAAKLKWNEEGIAGQRCEIRRRGDHPCRGSIGSTSGGRWYGRKGARQLVSHCKAERTSDQTQPFGHRSMSIGLVAGGPGPPHSFQVNLSTLPSDLLARVSFRCSAHVACVHKGDGDLLIAARRCRQIASAGWRQGARVKQPAND